MKKKGQSYLYIKSGLQKHFFNLLLLKTPAVFSTAFVLTISERVAAEEGTAVLQTANGGDSRMLLAVLIGAAVGLALLLYDVIGSLRDNKRRPAPANINPEKLSLLQMGVVFHENKKKIRTALAAEIMQLARSGYLIFVAEADNGKVKLTSSEIKVEILNSEVDSEVQQMIIMEVDREPSIKDKLKEDQFLEDVTERVKQNLKHKKLLSAANLQIRKRIALSSLIFFIPGMFLLFRGLLNGGEILTGISITAFFMGVSRLIKVMTIPVLSEEGLDVKNKIRDLLEQKKEELEESLTKKNMQQDSNFFWEHLPYIIFHPDFGRRTLKNYIEQLNYEEGIQLPKWIQLESGKNKIESERELYLLLKVIIYG